MTGRGDPRRVRDVLGELSPELRLGHALETGLLWSRWSELVGPAIAEHAEPTSLRDHVLRVRADSPAWATEITYLSAEIRSRANAALSGEIVREVRVWTGPGRASAGTARAPAERDEGARAGTDAGPAEALERARRAWAERRRGGLDRRPGSGKKPS